MPAPAPTAYERFLPWKRWFEIGFWVLNAVVGATFSSVTVVMDIHKTGLPFADWEPVVWECSSHLMWLAMVWPIAWFTRRYPFHWDTWRRQLPRHLLFSVAVSVTHVSGMVALRTLAYGWMGGHYDFGDWPKGLFYEYLKDVRGYFWWVLLIELYRLAMRRLQGEASLLAPPDEGQPLEPVDRPERFLVRKLGRDFLVATDEVEWVRAAGNYVNLRVRGHDYPLRSTMTEIAARLDPDRFVRIQRSYIVNLAQVASIEPIDGGEARIHLKDGTTLPCSRTYRAALREKLGVGEG
ncbi:LytTR family DNA-binding domain-containing protein [Pseudoxanthomonas winnipegensis]|uniref:LytTR family transcriptional regulator n=1 Tax=Pseudoxanthomonas winnipegensis TaxID=2480810 RepID=A0A4Q8M7Z2_9GAMM|nr:LytTR family DNA-binding domain-containing protein [Pseudoxanthomonas winnipegensis]TAA46327.1 LytTR family transcriptional regulator [Pseudoxanthomonas winnipegensis]